VENVERVLGESGLDPRLLTLEITESVLVQDPAMAQARLEALRVLGVRIAIDDFGQGYSSLAYLQRFPLDLVKIDQVFIATIDVNKADETIVASIIDLAHSLGLDVVAEGVERTTQLDVLARLGCNVIQGYVVSPAVPAVAAQQWVERGSWSPISSSTISSPTV
jgi:EAL domain-containing protein (putative c-di-GMP-specific phosphodiesterase class I)